MFRETTQHKIALTTSPARHEMAKPKKAASKAKPADDKRYRGEAFGSFLGAAP